MGARAFWTVAAGAGEIREEALPACGPGDVRVRTLYSGISRGTESLVFAGEVPDSEYQRMRAPFQQGEFPFPIKYGYAAVGEVVEGQAKALGRTVFCLHPHQTEFVVDAGAVVQLPPELPAGRAVLAANAETALNGLWESGASAGDRISVVGAGVVGTLLAYWARQLPGSEVQLVDVDPAKNAIAQSLGLEFRTPHGADAERDVVVHVSGNPEGLTTALELAGNEARVLEMSWFGTRPVTLPLGGAFHARRLTLRSSQVGRLPPERSARWSHRRRMRKALDLLCDPALDALITGEAPFEALPQTMAQLAQTKGGVLCQRVRYQEENPECSQ